MGNACLKDSTLQPDKGHSAMSRRQPNPHQEIVYGGSRRGVITGFDRCTFGNTASQFAREFSGNSYVLFRDCNFGQEGVSFKCNMCSEHLAWTHDIANIQSEKAKGKKHCTFPGYNGEAILQTFEICSETEDEEEQEEKVLNSHKKSAQSRNHNPNFSGENTKPQKRSRQNDACKGAAGLMEHQPEVSFTQFQLQQSANVQGAFDPMETEVQGACAPQQSSVPGATTELGNTHCMQKGAGPCLQVHKSPRQTTRPQKRDRGGQNLKKTPEEDIVLVIVRNANVGAKPLKGKHPAQTWYETNIDNAFCLNCRTLVGWVFNAKEESFFGLLMTRVSPRGN